MGQPSLSNREGTAEEWADSDFVLPTGMVGREYPTGRMKYGDGESTWADLEWSDEVGAPEQIGEGGPAYTDEQSQDSASTLLVHNEHVGISFNYDDENNKLVATVNLPDAFTPEMVQDAMATVIEGSGLTFAYDDEAGKIVATLDTIDGGTP